MGMAYGIGFTTVLLLVDAGIVVVCAASDKVCRCMRPYICILYAGETDQFLGQALVWRD